MVSNMKTLAIVFFLIFSHALCGMNDEVLKGAWRYNAIQEKKFTIPPSKNYILCNQQKSKRFNLTYNVSFIKDQYDKRVCCIQEIITGLDEILGHSYTFDVKTWEYTEFDDASWLRPPTYTPRFNVSVEQDPVTHNYEGVQKVFITDAATQQNVEVADHTFHYYRGRLGDIFYFQQDLVVVRKIDRSSFGMAIPTFQIYALNPWKLLRTVRFRCLKDTIVVSPEGTEMLLISVYNGEVHCKVIMLCPSGYEKLTSQSKNQDTFYVSQ